MTKHRGKRAGKTGHERKGPKSVRRQETKTRATTTPAQAAAPGSSQDHLAQTGPPGQAVTPPTTSPPRELLPTTPANDFAPCLPQLPV